MTLRMATPPLSGGSKKTMVDEKSVEIDTLSKKIDLKIELIMTELYLFKLKRFTIEKQVNERLSELRNEFDFFKKRHASLLTTSNDTTEVIERLDEVLKKADDLYDDLTKINTIDEDPAKKDIF